MIEVLIAMLIVTTAVIAMITIFPAGLASVQTSGAGLQAQAMAQQYVDLIREYYQTESNPPPNYLPGQNWTVQGPGPLTLRDQTQAAPTYQFSYTATNLATASAPTPEHDIVLTVTWTDNVGTHTRTYEAYVQN